ncbi:MAG: M50 family metallopeptidase [Corynebacterium sp.]|nr:M50 family metallopeptidase [Corynebacterium sp.]
MGYVAFAIGIILTIGFHELGHMSAARACGMRVRRFFIGFGPSLFSFRKGQTQYGLKIIPFGGFCDIAGMTNLDEDADQPWAMCKQAWWKRIIVLLGGIVFNLILGFVLLYCVAVGFGLPNQNADYSARIGQVMEDRPAAVAGILPGDVIRAVDGTPTDTFSDVKKIVTEHPSSTLNFSVDRDGSTLSIPVTVGADAAIGVVSAPVDAVKKYGAVEAVPATARFSGSMIASAVKGLAAFPEKLPGVAESIGGKQRDTDSPMSVVGATRIGGQGNWAFMFLLLASLNFFLALFNVLPIPPLDGGHVAIVLYEKIRNLVLRRDAGPVDYARVLPIIWVVSAILILIGVITVAADVVNPIRLN